MAVVLGNPNCAATCALFEIFEFVVGWKFSDLFNVVFIGHFRCDVLNLFGLQSPCVSVCDCVCCGWMFMLCLSSGSFGSYGRRLASGGEVWLVGKYFHIGAVCGEVARPQ